MKDIAYFCPDCGSPAIDRSALAGGAASCRACSWKGKNEDLHAVPFEHDFGSPDQAAERFVAEVSNLIAATLGAPIGRLLLKWGFCSVEQIAQELPVYGKAIASAAAKAILETREGLATGKIKPHPKKPEHQRRGTH